MVMKIFIKKQKKKKGKKKEDANIKILFFNILYKIAIKDS
jgi:hypothetical protein